MAQADDDFIMTVSVPLPCGHKLTHAMRVEGIPQNIATVCQHASEVLAFWVVTRTANHVCELVSAENPSGNSKRVPA